MRYVVLILALALPLAGCFGRVEVKPGVVAERSHEGPDGKSRDEAFYGLQVFKGSSENPADSPTKDVITLIVSIVAYVLKWAFVAVLGLFLLIAGGITLRRVLKKRSA